MKQEITSEQFRKNSREVSETFSKVIDINYQSFHDVAKAFMDSGMKNGTRIDTMYGSFTFVPDMFALIKEV